MVRRAGLEPAHLAASGPKPGASTNFATFALKTFLIVLKTGPQPGPLRPECQRAASTIRPMSQLDQGLVKAFHAGGHYENFPVASWLLPAAVRPAVVAVYRLARTGDDIADEGDLTITQRLEGLAALRRGLCQTAGQTPDQTLSTPPDQEGLKVKASPSGWSAQAIAELEAIGMQAGSQLSVHGLNADWGLQLLNAFDYDAQFEPFESWPDVISYCQSSAVPVGRILLGLFGLHSSPKDPSPKHAASTIHEQIFFASDSICTGLQLVNFGQDLHQDLGRHRPTLPKSDWPEGLSWVVNNDATQAKTRKGELSGVESLSADDRLAITRSIVIRGSNQLARGEDLPKRLYEGVHPYGLRLALEIAMILEGGQTIAQRLLQDPGIAWRRSIRLSRAWLLLSLVNRLPVHVWRLTQSTDR
jgi:phytoene/squalene synthetase